MGWGTLGPRTVPMRTNSQQGTEIEQSQEPGARLASTTYDIVILVAGLVCAHARARLRQSLEIAISEMDSKLCDRSITHSFFCLFFLFFIFRLFECKGHATSLIRNKLMGSIDWQSVSESGPRRAAPLRSALESICILNLQRYPIKTSRDIRLSTRLSGACATRMRSSSTFAKSTHGIENWSGDPLQPPATLRP